MLASWGFFALTVRWSGFSGQSPIVNFLGWALLLKGAPSVGSAFSARIEQAPHPQSRVQDQSRLRGDQRAEDDLGDRWRPCHPPEPGEPVEAAAA